MTTSPENARDWELRALTALLKLHGPVTIPKEVDESPENYPDLFVTGFDGDTVTLNLVPHAPDAKGSRLDATGLTPLAAEPSA